eukprot:11291471-Ditylum_brightwellii.AAC.1
MEDERRKTKKEYYELKKQSGKLSSTLIEEKAAEQTEQGNTDEAQRLHTMLYNEKKGKEQRNYAELVNKKHTQECVQLKKSV